ncbi:MAG: c-type cytochrome [Methylophilales bacterium]|nr:c-type cytochrome [Methylophilales bacterium]
MLARNILVSTLLASLIGFTGVVSAQIKLIKTTDGSEFTIPADGLKGTPAEAEFFKTGKNIYIGDAKAIAYGKKRFGLWSCTQCHGPTAGGQVGPGLLGPTFRYPKDATNKGMFETVWAGSNGGMGGKGLGIMSADDGMNADELLQTIAWIRAQSTTGVTGNEGL